MPEPDITHHAVTPIEIEQPTRARFGVLAYLSSLAFILYLDRLCISQAAPDIELALAISHTQMSFVFSAFTIAYALFEVVTGHWGDRFGSRGVLTRIVLWWSAFTALTGCVWAFEWDLAGVFGVPSSSWTVPLVFNSFMLLMLIRFLFGAGEAGALPNIARVTARWFPLRERALAQAALLTCMQLGGALAPVTAAYLIQGIGWRYTFMIFGSIGVVWCVFFNRWFRDNPAEHSAVNAAELKIICEDGARMPGAHDHPSIPWNLVLSSTNVWLLGSIITCGSFFAYMLMSWYPTYLHEGRGLDKQTAGRLASLVLTGGAIGTVLGGLLCNWVVRLTGEQRWSRALLGFCCYSTGALFLLISLHTDSALLASVYAAIACAAATGHQTNWWAVTTAISGRHLGALFGLMNSMGGVGAFLSPIFMGWFADMRKRQGYLGRDQWDPAFYAYAGVLFIGAVCWSLVDATKPVEPPGETRDEGLVTR